MQVSDLLVEVRDVDLLRVAQIEPRFLDLVATVRDSGVGEWTLRLPVEHPATALLREDGAGIIVTGPDDRVLFSGPTVTPTEDADLADPVGIATVTGVTDDSILWQRLAYPNPAEADVTRQTAAYDVRTGTAAAVMRDFVLKNIGWHGAPERRIDSLSVLPTTSTGPQITKSARFDVLGDLLREIATVSGLRFRLVQAGGSLHFEVLDVVDRRETVRFDLANGTLASQSVATSPPALTRAIVAGQGEGDARTFLERSTPESVASEATRGPWGRIERFIDQRNTDDPDELAQAGDKALVEEGALAVAVKAVPSDDLTMRYAIDWNLGDAVTVVVNGVEMDSTVTAVTIIANSDGVRVGTALGEAESDDPAAALGKRVDDTVRRVSSLERNGFVGLAEFEQAVRLQFGLVGGGTKSVTRPATVTYAKWSGRLMSIGHGRGPSAPSGYFDVLMPPVGTAIPVVGGGGGTVAVVADGVPLRNFDALYYEVPVGSTSGTRPENFRVARYDGANFSVPREWVLVAAAMVDGDFNSVRWGTGEMQYPWRTLTLTADWTHYTSANPPSCRLTPDGLDLRGLVRPTKALTLSTNSMLNVATGVPSPISTFYAATVGQTAFVEVLLNGAATLAIRSKADLSVGTSWWFSLDSLTLPNYP